jgi:hypothetical protein
MMRRSSPFGPALQQGETPDMNHVLIVDDDTDSATTLR